MDHALTCNTLTCRKELTDRALVTTCSHIFCTECAQKLNVANQDNQTGSACPACGYRLSNPDDAVITNLNPSEDYKTSVLSGLSPSIIMECAGRALSFWAYQATQDICYQQHLYKTLSEKYSNLTTRLDKTVNDANAEIDSLHRTISGMVAEQEALRRKNDELAQAYKEKSKKLLQTQELYDKAKRKAEIGLIQRAASDAVDSSLHNAYLQTRYGECSPNQQSDPPPSMRPPNLAARFDSTNMNTGIQRSGVQHRGHGAGWSKPVIPMRASITPLNSDAQQQGGAPVFGAGTSLGLGPGMPRYPLHQHERGVATGSQSFGNGRSGYGGVGLTSGLKTSQAQSHPGLDSHVRCL